MFKPDTETLMTSENSSFKEKIVIRPNTYSETSSQHVYEAEFANFVRF